MVPAAWPRCFSNDVEISPEHGNVWIQALTADSRAVGPGMLFAALPGAKSDGAEFIPQAVEAGAAAMLMGRQPLAGEYSVPVIRVDDPRRALALIAARYYARQPRTVAAVTGTNGKTSVSVFLRQIWERAGHKAASLGTIGLDRAGRRDHGNLTTPDPVKLHEIMADLAGDDVTHLALEASSHGLEQRRLDGVRFAAGGLHQPLARPSRLSPRRCRTTSRPSSGSSTRCCRRAPPPSPTPTSRRRRRSQRIAKDARARISSASAGTARR